MGRRVDDSRDGAGAAAAAARRAAQEEARRAEAERQRQRQLAAAAAAERLKAQSEAAAQAKADEFSTGQGSAAVANARAVAGSPDSVDRPDDATAPVAAPVTGSPDALEAAGAAEAEREVVTEAVTTFSDSVAGDSPLEATEQLNETLEELPPELRGDFLHESAADLEQLVENITELDGEETHEAVANLSEAADTAGPAYVEELTDPLARAIADGKLEQTGNDANGGFAGVGRGINTHNSEREFVTGVAELGEGDNLFRDALASSLSAESHASSGDRADRALGFAGAVATRNPDAVPDEGVWTQVREISSDVAGAVEGAVQRVSDLREEAADRVLDEVLGITESLESLEAGDTLTIGAGATVSAELHGELSGQLQVTRNDDGTYTVAGGATALGGVGAFDNRIAGGFSGNLEFTFDNLDDAIDGTQALSKLALGAAVPAVVGLTFPSPDELLNIGTNLTAIEVTNDAVAGLDARFGLSGVQGGGAEGSVGIKQGFRIELEDGQPTAVVARSELLADATGEASNLVQRLAPGALEDLQGTAELEGSILLEVRTPIDGVTLAEFLEEPTATPSVGEPTGHVTYTGTAQVNGEGVEGTIEVADLQSSEVLVFAGRAQQGDLEGAIAATGGDVTASWRTYSDDERGWLNGGLDVAVATVSGDNVVRRYDEPHDAQVRPNEAGDGLVFDWDVEE
ncbi:MAG: hypothetical protein JNK82_44545 [Myxococcaceae bacterium]|nr:hypothetical protein [Myxococcaceae bacterium]